MNAPNTRKIVSMSLSGEVSTKSSTTRKRFHRRLRFNLRAALKRHGSNARLHDHRDRIDAEPADCGAEQVLARVFGIQSLCRAHALEWQDPGELAAAGLALYRDRVAGRSFAVRARRVGQRKPISIDSEQLARRLGGELVEAGGRVDLDDPEIEVLVEIRAGLALFFDARIPGPGGLPVGTEGRALALISGGFDSAVAAWHMLRRGVELDFVLFSLAGWPQERAVRQVLRVLDQRWMAGAEPRLYVVDFRPVVAELTTRVPARYRQVLLKRLMLRAADRIAPLTGAEALVTGEAIGQVSSQTLANLRAIGARAEYPILRPLAGMNKNDIVDLAAHVGSADISAGVTEFCALDGARPATRCTPAQLDRQERRFGPELVDALSERFRVVPRSEFGATEADTPEIEYVPDHAAVIDLRGGAEHDRWAWPEAIHLEFQKALEHAGRLPGDRAYLLYCEVGLKSAYLAECMRAAGYEAYSFRGGVRAMQAHARVLDSPDGIQP